MKDSATHHANDKQKRPFDNERDQTSVYQLSSRRLFRYTQSVERRAMKQRVSDRRSGPRFDRSGELQQDRRLANRVADADIPGNSG